MPNYKINFGSSIETFSKKSKKVKLENGKVAVSGQIKYSDKSIFRAILILDEHSAGEHFGTIILLPNGDIANQNDDDFISKLNKSKKEVFPYKYQYDIPLTTEDIHIDTTSGWSNN